MADSRPTDVRILSIDVRFSRGQARTPLKFGAVVMHDALLCTVRVTVENRAQRVAEGSGAIFLADFWAFPSAEVSHADREGAMRWVSEQYAAHVASSYGGAGDFRHPVDVWVETQDELKALTR